MSNNATHATLGWIAALVVVAGAFAGYVATTLPGSDGQNGSTALGGAFTTNTRELDDRVSTTSVTFLETDGGTKTFTVPVNGADLIDLNMQFNASTTASKLVWYYEFSRDGVDWFGETAKSVSTATSTHSASVHKHAWTPGSSGFHRKNVSIDPVATDRQMRVVFEVQGANGSLWTQAVMRKPTDF